ncbi:hypothetical protein Tco_0381959 [Tanacetum coccineum]
MMDNDNVLNGILFEPRKRYYKDGSHTSVVEAKIIFGINVPLRGVALTSLSGTKNDDVYHVGEQYVSSEARSWSISTEDPYEEAARHALEQAPHSPEYVPDPMEPEDHAPPLPVDASPIALSPGYIADSDPEEDPEEDLADGGDNDDDESFDDDDDDDDDVEEDGDKEEEEHLAPADSTAFSYLAVDLVPPAKETEPFETNESAATPPLPPAYRVTARMSIRSETPIPFPSEEEVAILLALPTLPPSPLIPLSSPLP